MERVSVLCLLLLCSLSRADFTNSEVSEPREVRPESVNVPEQTQASPSDVDAVMREMSAKHAENRLMIQQLQTLIQGQAAELNSLKAWANVTENQVDSLRKDRAVGQVAFSASLLASGDGTIGPFNTDTMLIFKNVVTNIGNAYSPKTGFFIAPVRGVYHFELHIVGAPDSSLGSGAWLVKNGQNFYMAFEHQTSGWSKSSNGAPLLLEAGDVVFVRQYANSRIIDNQNHHTTFSGHLLFLM